VNFDPRALTGDEQAAFLPLVCGGVSGGAGGYAHSCQSLPGYPSQDYGGAGTGLGITLTSVIYGHLTGDDADEAYVSYQSRMPPISAAVSCSTARAMAGRCPAGIRAGRWTIASR
jgi:hypothetical protein